MTQLPNPDQLTDIAKKLREAATKIDLYGRNALRVAADHQVPLRSSSGGRSSKGDHADPTASAVVAGSNDPSTTWANLISDAWPHALDSVLALVTPIVAAGKLAANTTRSQPLCGNQHGCPDDKFAEPGRSGRCYTCWRHWRDHEHHDRAGRYHRTKPTPDLDTIDGGNVPWESAG